MNESRPIHRRKAVWIGGSVSLLIAGWFFTVDRSWFVYECSQCHWGKDTLEIRFLGHTLTEEVAFEQWSLRQKIAEELGVPCRHEHMQRWHKHRYWGLVYCAHPCWNGTYRIKVDEWFGKDSAKKLREYAKAHPELSQEFEEQVLGQRNDGFLRELLEKAEIE